MLERLNEMGRLQQFITNVELRLDTPLEIKPSFKLFKKKLY